LPLLLWKPQVRLALRVSLTICRLRDGVGPPLPFLEDIMAVFLVFLALLCLVVVVAALGAYYNAPVPDGPNRRAAAAAFWAAHWRNGLFVLGIAAGVFLLYLLFRAWPVATLVGLGIIVVLGLLTYVFGAFGRPLGYVLAGALGVILLLALACWIVQSWPNWRFNPCGVTASNPCQAGPTPPPAPPATPTPPTDGGKKTVVRAKEPECKSYREVADDLATQIAMGQR